MNSSEFYNFVSPSIQRMYDLYFTYLFLRFHLLVYEQFVAFHSQRLHFKKLVVALIVESTQFDQSSIIIILDFQSSRLGGLVDI